MIYLHLDEVHWSRIAAAAPSPQILASMIAAALSSRTDWAGHLSVVKEGTVRITPLPQCER